MMRWKLLIAVFWLSLGNACFASAAGQELHVRSAYTGARGDVVIVVEVPQGIAPKASDFHLLIDDRSVTAKEIHGQDLDITLLVDVSGSMKGRPLNDVKTALSSLLDEAQKARPQDRFELVSFGDKETVLSDLSQPRQYLKQAIGRLEARDRTTKLYQAVYNALRRPQPADPAKRRVVVVISDGKDEGSAPMREPAVERSKSSGTPVHAVFRGEVEKQYADELSKFAQDTAGRYRATLDQDQLKTNLKDIYRLETRSFLVSFSYDREPGKTTDAAVLELRPASGGTLRDKARAVPAFLVPPSPSYWIWLLLFLACVLLIGAVVVWRRRQEKPLVEKPVVVEPPAPEKPIVPPAAHVATRVISHLFGVPKPGEPTAMLIGVDGPLEGQQFSMDRDTFQIGAGSDNDIAIGEDEYVSAQHAYLRYEKGSLFIFDRTSRNGTFVNGSQVSHNGVVLKPGDRIQVGMSTFEIAAPR